MNNLTNYTQISSIIDPTTLSNLIGWWKFDEGLGGIVNDYSPLSNNLNWHGVASGVTGHYSIGHIGKLSGSFNKVSDANTRTHISEFDFGIGDFSIAFWINPNINTWVLGNIQGVIGQKLYNNSTGFIIYHDVTDDQQLRIRIGDNISNGTDAISTQNSVPAGKWTFVVAQRQSGILSIYINGILNVSVENSKNISFSTANFNIGFGQSCNAYYSGLLEHVQIYNVALNINQITYLSLLQNISNLENTQYNIYFVDVTANNLYSLYIKNGALTLSPALEISGLPVPFILKDTITGKNYQIIINNGEITFQISANTCLNSYSLLDTVTAIRYNVSITNSSLTINT